MIASQITVMDDLSGDLYPENHPWSVKIERNRWNDSVAISQGGAGVRPVYISRNQSNSYIGSRFADTAKLAESLTPSPEGRLEMLLFGHTSGTNTLFREINRLPPGNQHIVSSDNIRSQWTDRIADNGTTTLGKTADVFIELAQQRINQSPAGWLPLTGGIDSRTIASVLSNSRGIRTYTRGDRSHPEVKCASKIAACLNLNHYPTPFEPGYINGHFERILEETGGMVSVDHGHAIHPLKHLRRLSPGIAIPGLNGEYGRAFWPVYSSHSDRISPEDMAQKLFKMEMITRDSRYEILFEHETASMIESCFENYVRRYNEAAECACFNHPVAWNDEFYLRDRVRSFSAFGGNIWSSFFSLECPYLEENYIQSVRSLPPKLRTAPLIHIEIIKRLHPKLLRLPLYPSCKPLQKHWYDFAANAIRRSVAGRKGRKGTQRYAQWLRDEACFLEPYVLKAHESFCGFVRADVVKRLWMEHQAGLDHHRILCRLMTPAMVDDLYM